MIKPPPARLSDFLDAVHSGLSRSPKTLPCRFFYDLEGSLLFERICEVPEYYLTRLEDQILRQRSDEIAALVPQDVRLIELGSGSARKTRHLIEAFLRKQPSLHYLPVEISDEMLEQTVHVLAREYPRLIVTPVVGEYYQAMARLGTARNQPALILFLGSNLGNFDLCEAVTFLRRLREMMTARDRVLLGLDLRKAPVLLEAAYNDGEGVNARFNLNLLKRINRELDGTFDLDSFEHRALYNAQEGRIEIYLVNKRPQRVRVNGQTYTFEAGETIHTENSYKYTLPQIRHLAGMAGLKLIRTWQDDNRWFSVNLFAPTVP